MAVCTIRILLVEDSLPDARLIREALSETALTRTSLHHFKISHVERLAEAFKLLDSERYDVVLLDLALPDSDGLETVRRTALHCPDIAIIVLTVRDDETWAQEAMQAGAQDYIAKGRIEGVSVIRAVRYAMERKRAELERIELAVANAARIESDKSASRIRQLQMITDSALEHLSQAEVVGTLIERICQVLAADAAAIWFMDTKRLAKTSNTEAATDQLFLEYASRIAGQGNAAALGSEEPDELCHGLFAGSAIGLVARAPMTIRGKPIGVLLIGFRQQSSFSEEDLQLLRLVADRIAFVVDHARLYEAERKAKAEALFDNRLKDEFFATMSHELRTPVSAIVGWAGLLAAGKLSGDLVAKGIEVIQRNAAAQAALIDDLLDVSRIISGKLRLDIRPIDLTKVIEDAIVACRPAAAAKEIQIRSVMDRAAGIIPGDSNRLQQVICNLLSNAIKFTPKNGEVAVALQRVQSQLEITVSDTGEGIDGDFLPFVFERFRQAQGGSTRQHGGLGIGLSVVKHIVEQHGGTVRAESGGVQRGATFTVKLPVSDVRLEAKDSPSLQTLESSKSPFYPTMLDDVRVLVLDDEPDARSLLEVLFQQCNARVTSASSTSEALQAIAKACPDIVISDIGMPDSDGYDFVRRLRSIGTSQTQRLPAIALTAFGRPEDRLKSLAAGFDFHVAKPIDPAELVALVSRMVSRLGTAKDV